MVAMRSVFRVERVYLACELVRMVLTLWLGYCV